MTTTTGYGTWVNHGDSSSVTVEATVADYLDVFADEYNVDAIVAAYRDAINEALPDGVSLCGNDFYGPYYEADQNFDGYPLIDDAVLDIRTIITGVDLGEIVEKHESGAR